MPFAQGGIKGRPMRVHTYIHIYIYIYIHIYTYTYIYTYIQQHAAAVRAQRRVNMGNEKRTSVLLL